MYILSRGPPSENSSHPCEEARPPPPSPLAPQPSTRVIPCDGRAGLGGGSSNLHASLFFLPSHSPLSPDPLISSNGAPALAPAPAPAPPRGMASHLRHVRVYLFLFPPLVLYSHRRRLQHQHRRPEVHHRAPPTRSSWPSPPKSRRHAAAMRAPTVPEGERTGNSNWLSFSTHDCVVELPE